MNIEELPSGWIKAKISDLSIKISQKTPDEDSEFFYIDIGSINRESKGIETPQYIKGSDAPSRARKIIKYNDILVSLTRPNLNAVALVGRKYDGQIASTGFEVIRPVLVNSQYIFAIVKSMDFIESLCRTVQGALYPAAKSSDVQAYEMPLPPLEEQREIARLLDNHLTTVTQIQARLDAIPKILEKFRQSVLADAVSGRLTKDWRQGHITTEVDLESIKQFWENEYLAKGKTYRLPILNPLNETPVLPENWQYTQLGKVFDIYVGATPSRKEARYWEGCINWVSSSEVAFCSINSTKEKITSEGLNNSSTNIHPIGTVMLAMIGQGKTRGQVAILNNEACHNQNTAALRIPHGFVIPMYLYFFLMKKYQETRMVGSGNNQKALNKSRVQSLDFSLPPFEEQIEIVKKIENLFAYADQIEKSVAAAKARVDNLTQSILYQAFTGQLTAEWREQNPELISGDNSAEALLARIQSEK